ncbi:MAG: efflux RND transporter periplasmic adaptor subunit [Desulfomonilia bacterium]|jgi:HlyD family secretion protein|uniref:Nickel and cobalt resistance protein CnrB n=1 Tax=anaerobic digester metagenome TaxID=1263854 RepID=A0A485LYD2_9ZZZZ|nr:efflux RND transporter periplasmic adaptor subunit [Pseudomonadota bacterium]
MPEPTQKQIAIIALVLLGFVLLVYLLLPSPVQVQTARVGYAPMQVIVEEEGETRVKDYYTISSPVAATIRRIHLEAGDRVRQGQPLVFLEAPRASILDVRARDEAAAGVQAAEARLEQAREQARSAQAAADLAATELARTKALFESRAVSRQTLDEVRAAASQADADLEAAQAGVATARAELESARAALRSVSEGEGDTGVQDILRSPVTGGVLAVHRRSEGFVNVGEPLLDVGDIDRLEVWTDVLSQDAFGIRPGSRVLFDRWGGDATLEGVVDRIEPQAATVVSALGVEEQRVQVIANIISPKNAWTGLGSGYRVLSRFVIWEDDRVLQVPAGALFRVQDGWAAFVVENGKAVRKPVGTGQRSGLAFQVLYGLNEGDVVIVHPDDSIKEGLRVSPQED